jgi:hypothetical protein
MFNLLSRKPTKLACMAGLAFVATLLLADASSAEGRHVSSASAARNALARRCEPPPCPGVALARRHDHHQQHHNPPVHGAGSTHDPVVNNCPQGVCRGVTPKK